MAILKYVTVFASKHLLGKLRYSPNPQLKMTVYAISLICLAEVRLKKSALFNYFDPQRCT